MITCYIGLGSNLGNRQEYIETALEKIKQLMHTEFIQVSQVIETPPEGNLPQGLYLNCVAEFKTALSIYDLLKELQKIETNLGRVRTIMNAPREIDLDILLYGDLYLKEPSICVPHPRMLKRDFVMKPLEDIAPEVVKNLRRNFNNLEN